MKTEEAPFPRDTPRLLTSPLRWCLATAAKVLWFLLRHDLDRLHFYVRTPSLFGANRIQIGRGVNLDDAFFNVVNGSVTIGDYAFFGQGCMVLTGGHDYTRFDTQRQWSAPKGNRDIVIGRGVWVGSGAIILGGVTICDHAVIAAGSVVTRSCPQQGIYAGIPARLIKPIK